MLRMNLIFYDQNAWLMPFHVRIWLYEILIFNLNSLTNELYISQSNVNFSH